MPREKKLAKRADGRYKATYFGKNFYGRTSDEAKKLRDEYKRLIESGMKVKQISVAEFAAEWLPIARPEGTIARRTYNGYACLLDLMISVIGDKALSEITPQDIKKVFSQKFALYRDSYIKKGRYLYTSMFDAAVAQRYIATNPCRSEAAKPHKGRDTQSHRSITEEERYYIETTPHRIQPVAMLMLYSGMRDSEALAVDIDRDVDIDNRVIHLRFFRHVDHNQAIISEAGKTSKAARDIGLFPQLATYLDGIHGPVAIMRNGKVFSETAWRRGWNSFVSTIEKRMNGCQKRWYGKRREDIERNEKYQQLIKAGKFEEAIQYKPIPWKSFTVKPYDLRHTFCTYCRDHGIDINVVREWMGHTDLKMILKIYDHVSDERKASELQKIYNEQKNKELGQQIGSEAISDLRSIEK